MFPPRIELRTFSVLGRRDNHYTMETVVVKFFFVSNSIVQALNNSPKIYDAQWGVRIPDPYIESRMLYQLIRSDTSMQTPLDKHYFVCTMKDFSGLLSY